MKKHSAKADGGHNRDIEDWQDLFDFCDRIFYKKPTDRVFNVNPYPDRYTFD